MGKKQNDGHDVGLGKPSRAYFLLQTVFFSCAGQHKEFFLSFLLSSLLSFFPSFFLSFFLSSFITANITAQTKALDASNRCAPFNVCTWKSCRWVNPWEHGHCVKLTQVQDYA